MKTLRPAVQICLLLLCLLLVSTGFASASTVTLSGNILFSSLDGSVQDSDGLANGVFTVDGDLVVAGTINCNDDPPLSGNASACPIRIAVTGDLTMEAGSGIFTENRRGGGDGGNVELTAGGNVILRGSSGSLAGSVVSSGRTTGTGDRAGDITIQAGGRVDIETGSAMSSGTHGGRSGDIGITAAGRVTIAGLVAAGPSRTVLASALTGKVLDGGNGKQEGGSIVIRAQTSSEPGLRVEAGGIVVSQGEDGAAQLVRLESCGIEVRGLVAAIAKRDGPGRVVLRSGTDLLVDARDLGTPGSRQGRVRADATNGGASGFLVDLFASGNIQIFGPATSSAPFAVSSSPGAQGPPGAGGTVAAISLAGTLTGSGNAVEAGRSRSGNEGGTIDLRAKAAVTLDGAILQAVGDFTTGNPSRTGGRIAARSYQAGVSWTFGTGDVRPTGTGAPAGNHGTIALTACSGIDLTGSQFPSVGSPVLPFPVENDGVCSPSAPVLPAGEPPLPVCNEPPVADAQAVETDEDTPVTITLTGSDPNSDPLTFSIVIPPAHGSLGPLTSPTATSVQVVYTPDLNYNGSDSFTFQVDDGHGGTDTATVTITVNPKNDAPLASDDAYNVNEGETLDVSAPGLLDNDTDPESDTLTAVLDSGPAHASSFTLNPDGSFTYVHDGSETTSDSFTYHANDGSADSNVATVTIEVTAENDAPVADDDGPYTVDEGATLNVPAASGVLIGDTDPEGSSLTALLFTGPAHASSFTLNLDGSFTYVHNGSETTSDSFTYKANDGTTDSNVATVTIIINPMNDPPTANPDAADITEEAPNVAAVNTVSGNVLTNDTDPDSSLVVSAVVGGSVGNPRSGAYGSVTIHSDGSFTYTLDDTNPAVNALALGGTLVDAFGYAASDGALTSSSTLTVTIHGADDPATPDNDAHEFIGNTELRVDLDADGALAALATTPSTSGVLDGDSDPEGGAIIISGIVGCADVTEPFDCVLPGEGTVSLQSTGRFTFVPEPGDNDPTASFQYTLAGNPAPATVMLTRKERVWYVKNDDGGGTGVSNDPFATLAEAETASVAGDIIYVFEGDGDTTGYDQGIVLKSNQRLIGEGVQLDVPVSVNSGPNPTVLRDAGNRPDVDNVNAGGHAVSATDAIPARIAGLNLIGSGNAIDITTNAAFGGSGSLTVANNTIDNTARPGGAEGIDINAGGTGTVTLAVHDNTLTATGTALDIQETGTGTLTITRFDDNVVSGNTGGSGIIVSNAVFDSTPGGGLDTVNAGTVVIGASDNGVGGAGLALGNVQGDLHFASNLNIFADGGAGLTVSGIGAGFQFRVNSGGAPTGIIEATGSPAVDASAAALDLRLTSLKSTNSVGTGVSLTNVTGTFSAESGSSITNATGTDFAISGGTANVTYKGTITDDVGQLVSVSGATAGSKSFEGAISDGDDSDGGGVSLSGNTGATIRFSGGLTLSTGGNPAFAATGGGTLEVCDENPCNGAATGALINKITTTTGTALNVANTTISSNNLEFRSISSNGAPNGVVLNTTGAGGLKVTGTGSAGTGGTINASTGAGISLTSTGAINLSYVNVQNGGDDGIRGTGVNGINLTNLNITSNGNAVGERGIDITQLTGSGSMANTTVSGSAEHNVNIANTSGTLTAFNVTNSAFTNTNMATGDDGFLFENNGSGSMTVSITGSTFTDNKGDHFQASTSAGATGSLNVTFSNNTLTTTAANDPNVVGGGITLSPSGSADLTFTISNNNIQQAFDEAINLNLGTASTAAASMVGTISNNIIGTTGDPDSGSESGTGISVISNGAGLTTVSITGNQVRQYANPYGILVNIKEGSTSMNATITGNTVANPGSFAINGIRVDAGATAGDSGTLCAVVTGNSVADSGPGVDTDIRLRQRFNTTIRLPGYGGANNDTTAVNSFVTGNNAGSDVSSAHNVGGGGNGFVGGAACPTP